MITIPPKKSLSLNPVSSTQNVMQSKGTAVRPFTLRAASSQVSDLFRIEKSDGTPVFRIGHGGLGTATEEVFTLGQNLVLRGEDSAGSTPGGGQLGVKDHNGYNQIYMQGVAKTSAGAGPHLQMITGIGRPATEYWYTEVCHKHDFKHVWTEGIESYSSTQKHVFSSVVPTDDGAGNITFIYVSTIDWQTGKTIFNPGLTFPATYNSLIDIRSNTGQTYPTLTIRNAGFQAGDLQRWTDASEGVFSRINNVGYFMTRKSAAPADADLANGEGAIWIDTTTGNLKWKSKTSGGTVVTRSLTTA